MPIETGDKRTAFFGVPLPKHDDEPIVFYGPHETITAALEMDDGGCNFYFVVEMEYTYKRIAHVVGPDLKPDDDESTTVAGKDG